MSEVPLYTPASLADTDTHRLRVLQYSSSWGHQTTLMRKGVCYSGTLPSPP